MIVDKDFLDPIFDSLKTREKVGGSVTASLSWKEVASLASAASAKKAEAEPTKLSLKGGQPAIRQDIPVDPATGGAGSPIKKSPTKACAIESSLNTRLEGDTGSLMNVVKFDED